MSSMEPLNHNYSIHVTAQSMDNKRDDAESLTSIEFKTMVREYYHSSDRACTRKLPHGTLRMNSFRYPYPHLTSQLISEMLSQIETDDQMDVPFPLHHQSDPQRQLKWGETETPLQNNNDLINHIIDFTHQNVKNGFIKKLEELRALTKLITKYAADHVDAVCADRVPFNPDKKLPGVYLVIEKRVYLPHHEFEAMEAVKRDSRACRLRREVSDLVQEMMQSWPTLDMEWLQRNIKRAVRGSVNERRYGPDVSYKQNLTQSLLDQARREVEDIFRSKTSPADTLEKVVIDDDRRRTDECSICLKEFSINSEVSRMPCSHIYHQDCIRQWLKMRMDCPLCRFKLQS